MAAQPNWQTFQKDSIDLAYAGHPCIHHSSMGNREGTPGPNKENKSQTIKSKTKRFYMKLTTHVKFLLCYLPTSLIFALPTQHSANNSSVHLLPRIRGCRGHQSFPGMAKTNAIIETVYHHYWMWRWFWGLWLRRSCSCRVWDASHCNYGMRQRHKAEPAIQDEIWDGSTSNKLCNVEETCSVIFYGQTSL